MRAVAEGCEDTPRAEERTTEPREATTPCSRAGPIRTHCHPAADSVGFYFIVLRCVLYIAVVIALT